MTPCCSLCVLCSSWLSGQMAQSLGASTSRVSLCVSQGLGRTRKSLRWRGSARFPSRSCLVVCARRGRGSPSCGPAGPRDPSWGVLGLGLALPSVRSCGRCSWFAERRTADVCRTASRGLGLRSRHGTWERGLRAMPASGNADGCPGERVLLFLPWGLRRWQPSREAAPADPVEPAGGAWPLGQVPGVPIAPHHGSPSTQGAVWEGPVLPPSKSGSCLP